MCEGKEGSGQELDSREVSGYASKCCTVCQMFYDARVRGRRKGGVSLPMPVLNSRQKTRCYFESYFFVPVDVYTDALCPRTSTIGTRVVFPTFVQLSIPQIMLHMMRVVCCST